MKTKYNFVTKLQDFASQCSFEHIFMLQKLDKIIKKLEVQNGNQM